MKKKLINTKSNSGFTMADLVTALVVFILFTTIISSLMYLSVKSNMQVKMSGASINYAMQILEDIDKIPYENVENGMESRYINKFLIPSDFTINIDVSNYNEGNSKEDLIKRVKLTISYTLSNDTESIMVEKIKVKEL